MFASADDITDRQRREAILQEVQSFAEAIVKTLREPLLVLDKDLHLKMANQSFLGTSRASKAETEGRLLYELDNGPVGHPRAATPAGRHHSAAHGVAPDCGSWRWSPIARHPHLL